ncbi:MAG: tetratricopeptide repeat protein [Alphaproteobacteria bacterium]|nr:tetratricopeptide repeat protein [Alphaproteobacteria bacterium]
MSHPDQFNGELAEGRRLYRAGRYDRAKAILAAPARVGIGEAHELLAWIALRCNQPAEAEAAAGHALDCNPSSAAASLVHGQAFAALGRTGDASQSFARALALQPGSCDPHFGLARFGDPLLAKEILARAAALDPSRGDILLELGRRHAGDKRHDLAVPTLRKAAIADPASARIRFALGQALIATGTHGEAESVLDAARALDPTFFPAHYAYARALLAQQRSAEALQAMPLLVALSPSEPKLRTLIATAILNEREIARFDEAEALIKATLSRQPKHAYAHQIAEELASMRAFLAIDDAYRRKPRPTGWRRNRAETTEDLAEHVAGELLSATIAPELFSYAAIGDIFPASTYAAMRSHLPPLTLASRGAQGTLYEERRGFDLDEMERADRPLGQFWRSVYAALESRAVLEAFLRAFEADDHVATLRQHGLVVASDVRLLCDLRGYALGPHKDHFSRLGSIVFNLPADDSLGEVGTAVYRRLDGQVRFDNGIHQPFQGYERHARMPYLPNSAIAFLNLGESYHGVDAIDRPMERWTLQYSIRIERPS